MDEPAYNYPLTYQGNLLWPIVFLFIFPPIGILLFILNTSFRQDNTDYSLQYRGNIFWLYFWTIVFFPIAILLAIIRGFNVMGKK